MIVFRMATAEEKGEGKKVRMRLGKVGCLEGERKRIFCRDG